MAIPKYELDKATPLDTKTATSFFGSESTYFGLLEQYEDVSLLSDLRQCAIAVETNDWQEVKNRIHSIKGASAYAGASRTISGALYWMQFHFENKDITKMMDLYPRLIESVIEFRVYYRKILTERAKQSYTIDSQFETCPCANNYKITKIKDYQYKCEKEVIKEEAPEVCEDQIENENCKEETKGRESPYDKEQDIMESIPLYNDPYFDDQNTFSDLEKDDLDDSCSIIDFESRAIQSDAANSHQEKHSIVQKNQIEVGNKIIDTTPQSQCLPLVASDQGSHAIVTIQTSESPSIALCSCSKCTIF